MRRVCRIVLLIVAAASPAWAQADAVTYRVTFPEPEHHWLQVDATFPALTPAPLVARMSRSSPGRYAVHEFAKNVFSIEAFDGLNRRLTAARVGADEWRIDGHDGTVRVVYRIFGDTADGTYLGIDTTHAHMNMPATFMWAEGLDMRPIRVEFAPPAASNWRAATQLFATADPFTFTAPNLQYFMDSPVELADIVISTFEVRAPSGASSVFRVAAHSDGTQADIDALARSIERLAREQMAVFGEFPAYEPGHYTFLLDFVGWVGGDGMEHRNSTSISVPGLSMRSEHGRAQALSIISHEFFHAWNTERIRPVGIEPFDFTRQNTTCCLWFAEGFTEYYGPLLLLRAGLAHDVPVRSVSGVVGNAALSVRSAVEMSEHAPFADAGVANDMDDRDRTFISYYTHGAAIALALDLELRARSKGAVTLDDYMRRLWRNYGAVVDARPGYVSRPYRLEDLRSELAVVSGYAAFADEFFDRYVEGREAPDFGPLLAHAGFVVRPLAPERGWVGSVRVHQNRDGITIGVDQSGGRSVVPFKTPLYDAGIDEGDIIQSIDGRAATMAAWNALAERRSDDRVQVDVRRRDGRIVNAVITIGADPRVRVALMEEVGITPTRDQLTFRRDWLASRVR